MPENKVYYGDNLDVLRRYVKDESVDLVYLDPPFNSRQGYNVLFAEKDGTRSASQIMAFEDTWEWNQESARAYEQVVESGGLVAQVMIAFHTFLGGSDMMAYLAMMAPRLIELGRVLKETGSIYLHCDPTASHYLKMLMDAVFSPWCFRSEIVWKRSSAHSDTKQGRKQHGRITRHHPVLHQGRRVDMEPALHGARRGFWNCIVSASLRIGFGRHCCEAEICTLHHGARKQQLVQDSESEIFAEGRQRRII